jgi:FkbM family methyltransferase
MFRNAIRTVTQKWGYDFIKTTDFKYGKRYQRFSNEPNYDYFETPNGNYYFPKACKGDHIANTIKTGNLFDEAILQVAKQFIKPKSTVLDLGANFGQMSIEFSKLSDDIHVFAFEAQSLIYETLCKNIKANSLNNVVPINRAVFDKSGLELVFPAVDSVKCPTYGSYGVDLNGKTGTIVESITIDSMNFTFPVSFMKIDIQGSDLYAMRGAVKTIAKYKMPIIFEYEEELQKDFNTSFQEYVNFVDEIGYKFSKTIQGINYLIVPA